MKKIIIAPLNWGLGHATRCIPVIKAVLNKGFVPVIASDGKALQLLKQEFPNIEMLLLPSYHIFYGKNIRRALLWQVPKIWKVAQQEKRVISKYISDNQNVVGVVSDNRFGVRSTKVPSVYITHQVNVLSGFTTFFTSKVHQNIIKKFDEVWIPDTKTATFSGALSEVRTLKNRVKHIGVLSRFHQQETPKNIHVLAIVSGVEPNRTYFERKLRKELANYGENVVLIQGKISDTQIISEENGIKIYNFVLADELETFINSAKIIVCRSGYSSVMDLAVLQKKAFFIPTIGQNEQEYLARFLEAKRYAPFAFEEKFTVKMLKKVDDYNGLTSEETQIAPDLFCLFERE